MRRLSIILLLCMGCLPPPSSQRTSPRRPSSLIFSHSLGGSGTQLGRFLRPSDICIDVEGNLYVSDSGNRRVSKLDRNGRAISEFRGDPVGGFQEPRGVTSDGFYIWVADFKKGEVVRIDPQRHVTWVLSHGLGRRVSPWGIEVGSTGEVYVSDRENHQILIFDELGRLRGSFGRFGDNPGEFRKPSGIGVDARRRVYVCDPERKVIEVFDALGGYLFSVISREPPLDVDIDAYGNLFVASPTRIGVVGEKGRILDAEGPRSPGGILVKGERLYLTDRDSDKVLVFDIVYAKD